jgi:hypothetical protein
VIFNVNHTVDLPQEYDGEQEATEGGEDEVNLEILTVEYDISFSQQIFLSLFHHLM